MNSWIGVDLDGTLAVWEHGQDINTVGQPIALMVQRVKEWLNDGIEVRIVTARVATSGLINEDGVADDGWFALEQRKLIQDWCRKHIGVTLSVTASKDFCMIQLWDDRAIQVETNTGIQIKK